MTTTFTPAFDINPTGTTAALGRNLLTSGELPVRRYPQCTGSAPLVFGCQFFKLPAR